MAPSRFFEEIMQSDKYVYCLQRDNINLYYGSDLHISFLIYLQFFGQAIIISTAYMAARVCLQLRIHAKIVWCIFRGGF